ncbi:PepSY-associated TM helix domain-containing protein [Sphingorhabdus sp.]|uniref:PepSY-associated TM helix domain-containing protein n=1 Tax=Sphingorhabdus sp. TaxID=1902408 RepID=UPI0038FC7CC9
MAISTLTLRRWHRRFALVLGIFFVIQGLTGAIAQHRFWLMQATNPDLYRVKSNGNPLPPGDILAALKKSKPDFQVAHMMYPAAVSPNTAILVMGGRDTSKHDMSRMVTVDQFQDQVIAEQAGSSGWVGLADAIHKSLIFGTPGKVILTMLGVGVVIFSALGVVIWFRTRQTSRNAKGVVKLHRTAGIAASLFIISVAGTGTALNLYTWAEKTSGRSVFKSNMEMAAHSTMAMSPKVDANMAYAIAQKAVGNLHMSAFGPAGPHAKNYWFAFMDARLKRTDVLVDPQSGVVIGTYPSGLTSGGDGIRAWLFPIHSGYVVGPVGGVIYSLIGVSVSLWVMTGFIMWRRQRRPKRKAAPVAVA